jgi:hypothetical protein
VKAYIDANLATRISLDKLSRSRMQDYAQDQVLHNSQFQLNLHRKKDAVMRCATVELPEDRANETLSGLQDI